MSPNEPAADADAAPDRRSWRDMAVARSLDPARVRAERRVQRFLDAALELISTDSDKEFTVQEVVERSGQSLRSFYQYFAGKHELLLALFEEAVRSTTERLEALVADEEDPLERLRRFTVEYYRMCRPAPKKGRKAQREQPAALADFAQQLLTKHPKEASQAYVPLVSLLVELLDSATAADVIDTDIDHERLAGIVLQSISFNAFSTTISGSSLQTDDDVAANDLWGLILHGIGVD